MSTLIICLFALFLQVTMACPLFADANTGKLLERIVKIEKSKKIVYYIET